MRHALVTWGRRRMSADDFRTEPTGARMAGTVIYRCAACSELIEGRVVFAQALAGLSGLLTHHDLAPPLHPGVRTYHPEHVPKET